MGVALEGKGEVGKKTVLPLHVQNSKKEAV